MRLVPGVEKRGVCEELQVRCLRASACAHACLGWLRCCSVGMCAVCRAVRRGPSHHRHPRRPHHSSTPHQITGASHISATRCGVTRCDTIRYIAVWCGAVQCGIVQCNAVGCDAVRCHGDGGKRPSYLVTQPIDRVGVAAIRSCLRTDVFSAEADLIAFSYA